MSDTKDKIRQLRAELSARAAQYAALNEKATELCRDLIRCYQYIASLEHMVGTAEYELAQCREKLAAAAMPEAQT